MLGKKKRMLMLGKKIKLVKKMRMKEETNITL